MHVHVCPSMHKATSQVHEYPIQRKVLPKCLISTAQMCGDFCSTLHTILYPGYKIILKLNTSFTKRGASNGSSFKTSVYYSILNMTFSFQILIHMYFVRKKQRKLNWKLNWALLALSPLFYLESNCLLKYKSIFPNCCMTSMSCVYVPLFKIKTHALLGWGVHWPKHWTIRPFAPRKLSSWHD